MAKKLVKLTAAGVVYAGFAVYLYQPYFKSFEAIRYLVIANVCLACLGCFVLSRRWMGSFAASFFAGAIYGFGPFVLGLTRYHPAGGLLAAAVPWLFCPAAFGPKGRQRWLSRLFLALPVVTILSFFRVSAYFRLFAIPIQDRLHLADLAGLLAPLVMADRGLSVVGFYHVLLAPLMMGFCILLAARRFGIMAIFVTTAVLGFCEPVLGVSPIIWFSIAALCCSVLIGVGIQGLAGAGFADRRWVLAVIMVMLVLSSVTLLLAVKYFQLFAGLGAKNAKLLTEAARMYLLGAAAVAVVFFMARARLRLGWLRLVMLCSAMTFDIFIGARFIVDKIF
jgi:hypothetical protein